MVLTDSLTSVFHDRYADAVLDRQFGARINIDHLQLEVTANQGQKFVDEQFTKVTTRPRVDTNPAGLPGFRMRHPGHRYVPSILGMNCFRQSRRFSCQRPANSPAARPVMAYTMASGSDNGPLINQPAINIRMMPTRGNPYTSNDARNRCAGSSVSRTSSPWLSFRCGAKDTSSIAGRVEPLKSPAPQPFPAAHLGQAAVLSTATVALPGPIDMIFPIGASIRALCYGIQSPTVGAAAPTAALFGVLRGFWIRVRRR